MTKQVDAIVIGAGQAGPSLAVKLAGAGQSVVLVERRALGGTCVNDGCIPSKTMIASARAAWVARNAASYGVDVGGEVRVDLRRVKARKDEVVQASKDSLAAWIAGTAGLELVLGHARFVGPRAIEVDGQRIEAKSIFLNVGARPTIPSIEGLADVAYLTSTSIMDLVTLPEHLVIVGGSYVALEFAQMFRRFGSRVTVLERGPRILAREDRDVSEEITRFLRLEGIDVKTGFRTTRIASAGDGVEVVAADDVVRGSHLLVAVGRTPNTDELGVEHAGLAIDARGYVTVDDELRTSVPGVWAIGDCNGRGGFTHTSYNDYEIVAANVLGGAPRRVTDRIETYAVFVDPPLGRVGMTEDAARASGKRVLLGKRMMTRVGRARERGETHGFIKVLVDADSKRLLGATILGIEGDEAVHALADVMYANAPFTVIANAVHIHPTVGELVPTTLQDLVPLD